MAYSAPSLLRKLLLPLVLFGLFPLTLPRQTAAEVNHDVEVEHLQSLTREGKWLAAIAEANSIMQRMRDNAKTEMEPVFYLRCAVFLAQTAVDAGDSKAYEGVIVDLEGRMKDRVFASTARQFGPAVNLLMSDLRVRDLINRNELDKALQAITYRPEYSAGQASEEPKQLIFTDAVPLGFATNIHLLKGDASRAETYLKRLQTVLSGLPNPDPEAQATAATLSGRVASLEGRTADAQTDFQAARELLQTAFNGDHPKAIPTLIATAKLSLKTAEAAHGDKDLPLAALSLRNAKTTLDEAKALATRALADQSGLRRELTEVEKAVIAAEESWGRELVPLERAEKAARETLRLLQGIGVAPPAVGQRQR